MKSLWNELVLQTVFPPPPPVSSKLFIVALKTALPHKVKLETEKKQTNPTG